MKKINKIQKLILIIMGLIVIIIGIYVLNMFLNKKNNTIETSEVIKYNYTLYKRDNDLYKEIFNKLKDVLNEDSIDYEKYAEYITELFVIDFYTLDNKTSKEDIGGLQYIYQSMRENFVLKASNTIYKHVESLKELTNVNDIELKNIEKSTYKIDNIEYESYKIELVWEYKNDYNYDKDASFIVIKDSSQLYIVEEN